MASGTGATSAASARQNLGLPFGGMATELRTISYGGDNGVEFRIYGSDSTVYALVVYVNAIALNVSYDGGATWANKWTK